MNDIERKIDDFRDFIENSFGDIDDLVRKKCQEIGRELTDLAEDIKEDN